jgi:hypothetical protein
MAVQRKASQRIQVIAGGCSDTIAVSILVNPLPNGSIAAGGPTTFCSGSSVTLNTAGDPHTMYRWYENGSLMTYTVYYNSQYYTYPVTGYSLSVNSSGTYSAMIIDTLTGCSQMTNSISVLVNSATQPVISANGGTTLCIGANTLLAVAPPFLIYGQPVKQQKMFLPQLPDTIR